MGGPRMGGVCYHVATDAVESGQRPEELDDMCSHQLVKKRLLHGNPGRGSRLQQNDM